jgi:hypothetical protein
MTELDEKCVMLSGVLAHDHVCLVGGSVADDSPLQGSDGLRQN